MIQSRDRRHGLHLLSLHIVKIIFIKFGPHYLILPRKQTSRAESAMNKEEEIVSEHDNKKWWRGWPSIFKIYEVEHGTLNNFRPCLLVRCQNLMGEIMFEYRFLEATVCLRDSGMNEDIDWHWRQQLSGPVWLGWQVRKGPHNSEWTVYMMALSVAIEMSSHTAGHEKGKLHSCAEGRGPYWGLCWCLVFVTWGTGMFSRPRSESKREQSLGERMRSLRISRTKQTLLGSIGMCCWPGAR